MLNGSRCLHRFGSLLFSLAALFVHLQDGSSCSAGPIILTPSLGIGSPSASGYLGLDNSFDSSKTMGFTRFPVNSNRPFIPGVISLYKDVLFSGKAFSTEAIFRSGPGSIGVQTNAESYNPLVTTRAMAGIELYDPVLIAVPLNGLPWSLVPQPGFTGVNVQVTVHSSLFADGNATATAFSVGVNNDVQQFGQNLAHGDHVALGYFSDFVSETIIAPITLTALINLDNTYQYYAGGIYLFMQGDSQVFLGGGQSNVLAMYTAEITGLTLADGSSLESHGIIAQFGSGFSLNQPTPVPEPSSLTLAGLGIVGIVVGAYRRRRAAGAAAVPNTTA